MRDWLGAAEYILNEGNNKVFCAREVTTAHTHKVFIEILIGSASGACGKEITHLPVVTDPSHATFWRPWVLPMTLASLGAGADGIMLEVHPNPSEAAVDPLQAIDYKSFSELMEKARRYQKC